MQLAFVKFSSYLVHVSSVDLSFRVSEPEAVLQVHSPVCGCHGEFVSGIVKFLAWHDTKNEIGRMYRNWN